jgi:two-component system, LytTR family, response regulator
MATLETTKRTTVIVSDAKNTRVIPMEMIVYIAACGPYSLIHKKNGEQIVWCKHLKLIEPLLDADRFVRIHKGYLVNIGEITQYIRGRGGRVLLSNGSLLEVSYRRKGEFLERYTLTA